VTLSGRSAVSWQAKGSDAAPVFGVFWFDATVLIDKEQRTLTVEKVDVTKVRFPNVTPEKEQAVAKVIEAEVPKWDVHGSLDEIQAALAVTQRERASEKGLSVTPPKLVFSNDPAVLLLYDGEPALRPIGDTGLERVVNTPLFVVKDPAAKKLFLGGGKYWYEGTDPKGPWTPVAQPSAAVADLLAKNPPPPLPQPDPAAATTVAAKAAPKTSAKAPAKAPAKPEGPPRIVVATQPTELVVFDGKPSFVPVGTGGDLLWADNCDAKVLVHVPANETYVLVSGRWYKAASLSAASWTPVRPDKLPAAFKSIPPDSPVGDVRSFVHPDKTEPDGSPLARIHTNIAAAERRNQRVIRFALIFRGPWTNAVDMALMEFFAEGREAIARLFDSMITDQMHTAWGRNISTAGG
jgi:hypothetical protein